MILCSLAMTGLLSSGGPTIVNVARAVTGDEWQVGSQTVFRSADTNEIEVYDAETHSLFSTGVPAAVGPFVFGRLALFLVDEAVVGQDLDQDGKTDHWIHFVLDLETLAVTSLGLPARQAPAKQTDYYYGGDGYPLLTFSVPEILAGDLNGDGDASDTVTHVFDTESGEVRNLGLARYSLSAAVGDQVYIVVSEVSQGLSDLNGDGQIAGFVLFRHDFASGTTDNTGFPGWRVSTGLAAVLEEAAGIDLDGDGLISPFQAFFAFDETTYEATPLNVGRLPYSGLGQAGRMTVINACEAGFGAGIDVNGDGDLLDATALVWDAEHARLRRTGVGASNGTLLGGYVVSGRSGFSTLVDEAYDQVDATGDGDTLDFVVKHWRESTGVETAPWAVEFGLTGDGEVVAFHVDEANQGADLDGDGQLASQVFIVQDFGQDEFWVLPWTFSFLRVVTGGVVYYARSEFSEGQDLNGDGVLDDAVLFSFETETGQSVEPPSVTRSRLQDPLEAEFRRLLRLRRRGNGRRPERRRRYGRLGSARGRAVARRIHNGSSPGVRPVGTVAGAVPAGGSEGQLVRAQKAVVGTQLERGLPLS